MIVIVCMSLTVEAATLGIDHNGSEIWTNEFASCVLGDAIAIAKDDVMGSVLAPNLVKAARSKEGGCKRVIRPVHSAEHAWWALTWAPPVITVNKLSSCQVVTFVDGEQSRHVYDASTVIVVMSSCGSYPPRYAGRQTHTSHTHTHHTHTPL